MPTLLEPIDATKEERAGPYVRVLIAENDPYLRWTYQDALASQGLDVITASDGVEVLDITKRLHFDVVVSEASLPAVDGVEVTRALHRREDPPAIVLLTPDPEPGLLSRAAKAGATEVIQEPVAADDLAREVVRLARGEETE